MTLETLRDRADALRAEIGRTVLGQEEAVDLLLVALFARGHILLEGPPGTAKTLLARSFAAALAQKPDEAGVRVRRRRQVVYQQGRIDFGQFGDSLLAIKPVHCDQAGHQSQQWECRAQHAPQAKAFAGRVAKRQAAALRQDLGLHHQLGFAGGQGLQACHTQAFAELVRQLGGRLRQQVCQVLAHAVHGLWCGKQVGIFHGLIPWAARIRCRAAMAREQCVLTLPSVQPITAAVSATSNSSQ